MRWTVAMLWMFVACTGGQQSGDYKVASKPKGTILSNGDKRFGPKKVTARHVSLPELLGSVHVSAGKTVETSGKISKVCQASGCWFELCETVHSCLRVEILGAAFVVPRDIQHQRVTVQGEVRQGKRAPVFQARTVIVHSRPKSL